MKINLTVYYIFNLYNLVFINLFSFVTGIGIGDFYIL